MTCAAFLAPTPLTTRVISRRVSRSTAAAFGAGLFFGWSVRAYTNSASAVRRARRA